MKLTIYAGSEETEIEMEVFDIKPFINLLKLYPSVDSDGTQYSLASVAYDASGNHFDIVLEEE